MMKTSEIAALLDEPACGHNEKSKSGCARPKPGASAGGCAFDGAQIALLPIADVAHIVHGPIACAGSSWDNRGTRSSGPTLYRIGMTTDLTEQDVIMGRSEKRLFHSVKQAVQSHDPAAVFVYNTCVPALIGDDLDAVCKAATEKFGAPVIPVDCAGFYGTKNLGNRIAGEAMVKHVVGTGDLRPSAAPPRPGIKTYNVNLIGEYNIAGELWHVTPLLDELGLRVICALSGDARFHQVQAMHHADVNMMVCSKAMLNVARKLEDSYGTPWFEGSFYGISDVSDALRNFAKAIGDPDLTARTEALIAREEARVAEALKPWGEKLSGKRVLLYTGGVKSWSVIAALQELGMTVVASGAKKSTEEDKARIRDLMGEEAQLIDDGAPRALLKVIADYKADMLIAGGRNMYTALKARIPFLDINQERDFGYAGYQGMVELARQLALTINAPVWEAARAPAPWAAEAGAGGAEVRAPAAPTPTPIEKRKKALSVSPLKSSQPLGAALAFLGLHRAMPMLHGSQGCTAFGKVFFVRHFREPVPLQTTAMDQVSTVMGAEENVVEGLAAICSKSAPQVIGLPSTGLSETQGSYMERAIKEFRENHPEHDETLVIPVATPDFKGCLESGFAAALRAIVEHLVPDTAAERAAPGFRPNAQVNILVGSALTPGDLDEIKNITAAFGLEPFVLPDISDSLDGRLTAADFEPLTIGGTRTHLIKEMGAARANLVIGASLAAAGDLLERRTGAPTVRLDHVMGLGGTDALIQALAAIADRPVPRAIERERARLLDAMLDCHFSVATSRFGVASDPDLLKGFSDLLAEAGAETVAAVAPSAAPVLERVSAPMVKIGDLEDLETLAGAGGAEMLIGNSHVASSAERLGLPVLRAGFPLFDQIGAFERLWVGYRGARQALYDLANALDRLERGEIAPYRSIHAHPELGADAPRHAAE
ncbi:MAG: nitrogenase iron-molybdenum cofactor biosynthesis protein NifE [Pseudomonadota bacterium]